MLVDMTSLQDCPFIAPSLMHSQQAGAPNCLDEMQTFMALQRTDLPLACALTRPLQEQATITEPKHQHLCSPAHCSAAPLVFPGSKAGADLELVCVPRSGPSS